MILRFFERIEKELRLVVFRSMSELRRDETRCIGLIGDGDLTCCSCSRLSFSRRRISAWRNLVRSFSYSRSSSSLRDKRSRNIYDNEQTMSSKSTDGVIVELESCRREGPWRVAAVEVQRTDRRAASSIMSRPCEAYCCCCRRRRRCRAYRRASSRTCCAASERNKIDELPSSLSHTELTSSSHDCNDDMVSACAARSSAIFRLSDVSSDVDR
jgi:hypothetical protein